MAAQLTRAEHIAQLIGDLEVAEAELADARETEREARRDATAASNRVIAAKKALAAEIDKLDLSDETAREKFVDDA